MIPDHEQVKSFMNEIYNNFYLKWRNELTLDNVEQMMQEVYDLDIKYPFELCHDVILGLVECIEDEYRRRNSSA